MAEISRPLYNCDSLKKQMEFFMRAEWKNFQNMRKEKEMVNPHPTIRSNEEKEPKGIEMDLQEFKRYRDDKDRIPWTEFPLYFENKFYSTWYCISLP
ncbi:hypothetical protein V6N13_129999 [Hibiscus sabdariffa]|uniref:Uncharacterized protein n=1 Tax=Hibiscus sabdariffa TaxID=183260 RepID=A0ABR2SNR4_9ROSI